MGTLVLDNQGFDARDGFHGDLSRFVCQNGGEFQRQVVIASIDVRLAEVVVEVRSAEGSRVKRLRVYIRDQCSELCVVLNLLAHVLSTNLLWAGCPITKHAIEHQMH
eukprot:3066391-Pyramimonas_sp.AAC.1